MLSFDVKAAIYSSVEISAVSKWPWQPGSEVIGMKHCNSTATLSIKRRAQLGRVLGFIPGSFRCFPLSHGIFWDPPKWLKLNWIGKMTKWYKVDVWMTGMTYFQTVPARICGASEVVTFEASVEKRSSSLIHVLSIRLAHFCRQKVSNMATLVDYCWLLVILPSWYSSSIVLKMMFKTTIGYHRSITNCSLEHHLKFHIPPSKVP